MAAISKINQSGPAVLLVNAAHITEKRSDLIEFEILDVNSGSLKKLIGEKQLLACDDSTFWGELISLEPCVSTASGLGLLRNKPTLKGIIRIFPGEPPAAQ
jgi:hypothetical protein